MSEAAPADWKPSRLAWAALTFCACVLLFAVLGGRALWGSEGRWAEVVREMFITGDFLHPRINWEPYFDKPLVSYWFIAAFAWLRGGSVNELLARLPSAIAALGALAGTFLLAKKLWNCKTAFVSSWILLTAYSFVFWGRTAAADMENVAFTILAVAWYFISKDKPGFFSYFLFWAICAIGGQTKGLGAIVVPAMLVGMDMLLCGSWKKHLGVKSVLAAAAGAFVYFIPFMIEAATRGDYGSSGLHLVFKENIQRFFQPFDHAEPWHVYFVYLPQLFLPWTPLLVLAIAWAAKEWQRFGHAEKWLCLANIAVFAIFTLSGSRRNYYILPILPFCAILCGAFLNKALPPVFEKAKDILFKVYEWTIVAGCLLMAASPLVWGLVESKASFVPPQGLPTLISASGVACLALWAFMRMKEAKLAESLSLSQPFARVAACVGVLLMAFVGILHVVDSLRTEKAFAIELKGSVAGLKPENVVFYFKSPTNTLFYMGTLGRMPVLEDDPKEAKTPVKAEAKLAALMERLPPEGIMLVSERRYIRALPEDLRERIMAKPYLAEPSRPWEKSDKSKLVAKRLLPASGKEPR